jgi:hypothetical protein
MNDVLRISHCIQNAIGSSGHHGSMNPPWRVPELDQLSSEVLPVKQRNLIDIQLLSAGIRCNNTQMLAGSTCLLRGGQNRKASINQVAL